MVKETDIILDEETSKLYLDGKEHSLDPAVVEVISELMHEILITREINSLEKVIA